MSIFARVMRHHPALRTGGSVVAAPPAPVDPYRDNVTLLMRFEGDEGSQEFLDESPYGNTITTTAQLRTEQAKYGQSSGFFNNTYANTYYDPSLFDWFTGDYTLELWVYPLDLSSWGSSSPLAIGNYLYTTNYWSFGPSADGKLRFYAWNGSQNFFTSLHDVLPNEWTHLAMTHAADGVRLFVNGQMSGPFATAGGFQSSPGVPLASTGIHGYLDDLRITKGVARYLEDFTPPATTHESLGAVEGDEFYHKVALLLSMDGEEGSTAFVDSSRHALTTTTYAPAAITTTNFQFGGASGSFGGGVLAVADSPALRLQSGDYTIEFWFFAQPNGGWQFIYAKRAGYWYSNGILIALGGDLTPYVWVFNGSGYLNYAADSAAPANQWNHFAFTREGDQNHLWLNGKNVRSFATTTPVDAGHTLYVGGDSDAHRFFGLLDDLRVTDGVARYKYGGSFTPPTQAFSPVSEEPLYGDVALLLQDSLADDSPRGVTIYASGAAAPSTTQVKVGTHSFKLNGLGDRIYNDSASSVTYGTQYTLEMWVYIIDNINTMIFEGGPIQFYLYQNAFHIGPYSTIVYPIPSGFFGSWVHLAIVREGTGTNQMHFYYNGVKVASGTNTSIVASAGFQISRTSGYLFSGYFDSLRLTNAVRYTTDFTPPTDQFADPDAAGVSLLLSMDGVNGSTSFVDSSPFGSTITANGNAQISTSQSKFGGASAYFDGIGSYILTDTTTSALTFGTGDFTIEFWLYPTSTPAGGVLQQTPTSAPAIYINIDSTYGVRIGRHGANQLDAASDTLSLNAWTHLAFVRDSGVVKIFFNGVSQTLTNAAGGIGSYDFSATKAIEIGRTADASLNGYIDDLRITKKALYTNDFTPPQSAHLDSYFG